MEGRAPAIHPRSLREQRHVDALRTHDSPTSSSSIIDRHLATGRGRTSSRATRRTSSSFKCRPGCREWYGDRSALMQVFVNLATNALPPQGDLDSLVAREHADPEIDKG